MWREELFHPKVIHFAIALLVIGSCFYILGLLLKRKPAFAFLLPSARLLVLLGTLAAWVSVYSGLIADDIVGRELCDPLVLNTHEQLAMVVSWLFSAAWILDRVMLWTLKSPKAKKVLSVGIAMLFMTGSGLILYVGHLGGKLVFQQSAAVHTPTEDCVEFE
jgi:uncharacterized membrane protein